MSDTLVAELADISGDAPAGENLEFDPDFDALDRACQGKPETQYGDTIIPAVPPEWKEAIGIAESLLKRTRDLRIMALLGMARLNTQGLPAFAKAVSEIRHQVQERWDVVHPQLDPEDDNDPTLRSNALFRLQDPTYVLRVLRDMPLASSAMTGPVTWRDISIFEGTQDAEEGKEPMTEAFIRGAFRGTNAERLGLLTAAVEQLQDDFKAIPAVFDEKAGYGSGPDLSNVTKLLADIRQKLRRFEPVPDAAEEEVQEPSVPGDDGDSFVVGDAGPDDPSRDAPRDGSRGGRRAGGINVRSITQVSKRDEALYLLELASSYFRANEPSSPLPMLIDRARRLATMEFMDLLRDLAPDGLSQAQVIAGPPPESQGGSGW